MPDAMIDEPELFKFELRRLPEYTDEAVLAELRRHQAVKSILLSGAVAGIVSTVALGGLARLEGKSVFQPVNSTSHWLHGTKAASFKGADINHTAVGLATHQAATFFWAALFEWSIRGLPRRLLPMLGYAVATSAVAAAVDYEATPKRFTPGWEFVLSKSAMAATYAAMAGGLAAGALLAGPARRPSRRTLG